MSEPDDETGDSPGDGSGGWAGGTFHSIEWRSVVPGALVMAASAYLAASSTNLNSDQFFLGGVVAGATAAFIDRQTTDTVGEAVFAVLLGTAAYATAVLLNDLLFVGGDVGSLSSTTANSVLVMLGFSMVVAPFAGIAGMIVGGIRNWVNEKREVEFLED